MRSRARENLENFIGQVDLFQPVYELTALEQVLVCGLNSCKQEGFIWIKCSLLG